MEPRLIQKEAFMILGLQERFTSGSEDFEGIWKRYMRYHHQIETLSTDGAFYGVNFVVENGKTMDYLVGMAVSHIPVVPDGLALREIPASRYAVFECTVATIGAAYDWIFGEWLKTAPYARPGAHSPKADFERYPPVTETGDAKVFLHIALEDDL